MSPALAPAQAESVDHGRDPTRSIRPVLKWAYLMTVGRFAITAGMTIWMAVLLSPGEFGVMALAMVWVTFAQLLISHGAAQAIIQRTQIDDNHCNVAFWGSLGLGVALAGVFAAVAPLWAAANRAAELTVLCWALAPVIVLHALSVVPDAILRRQMQFKRLSMRLLVAGLVSGIAGLAAAVAGYGVWALVLQQVVLTGLSAGLVWLVLPWRPRFSFKLSTLREMRRFSLHSMAEFLAYFVSSRGDALLLGALFGPIAIGMYRFAVRVIETVMEVAAGALSQVSLPHLSRFNAERQAFAAQLGVMTHASAVLALPSFGVLATCAPHLLALLGPDWVAATPGLLVMCVDGATGALGIILGPAIQAAGRPGVNAVVGWIEALVTISVVGAVGVMNSSADAGTQVLALAVAYLVVRVAFLVGTAVFAFRWIFQAPLSPVLRPIWPAALSALVALGAGWLVQEALDGVAPLVALALTASTAAATAAVVLLVLDAEVSALGRNLFRSVLAPARTGR